MRLFGDDIADWLEGSELVRGEMIGLPFQFFVWLRPNFEMTDATAFKAK